METPVREGEPAQLYGDLLAIRACVMALIETHPDAEKLRSALAGTININRGILNTTPFASPSRQRAEEIFDRTLAQLTGTL